jgi:hypothetical protein
MAMIDRIFRPSNIGKPGSFGMTERPYLIILFIALCLAGCEPAQQNHGEESGSTAPDLILERWPGEGVPVLAWQGPGDSLRVYPRPEEARSNRSPADGAGRIAAAAGQRLDWDRSVIRIEQPGQMEITEDCVISGFVYDPPQDGQLKGGRARDIYLPAGTLLEVICYAAEGFYIFRHQGEYIEMDTGQSCQRMLSEPQTEWWVRITGDGSIGWIPVDGSGVAVIDRRF